jgi:hypothetical protein
VDRLVIDGLIVMDHSVKAALGSAPGIDDANAAEASTSNWRDAPRFASNARHATNLLRQASHFDALPGGLLRSNITRSLKLHRQTPMQHPQVEQQLSFSTIRFAVAATV